MQTPPHSKTTKGSGSIRNDIEIASGSTKSENGALPETDSGEEPKHIIDPDETTSTGQLEKGMGKDDTTSEAKKNEDEEKDPNLVTWTGPEDPANPRNWPFKRKWAATLIASCFALISPVSSSMVAPSIDAIKKEFGISSSLEGQLTMSSFVLAYAIGPLFLGPLSEVYGRVPVLQLANLIYLIFNTACGFCTSKAQLIVFRFLSGLGGSAPLSISGGIVSDLFTPAQRGRAISLYALAPLLGPAVGPIAGGFITEYSTWRWSFHATSIADAIIQVAGLIWLQETYAPKLLQKKAKHLRKETGNTALYSSHDRDPLRTSSLALIRRSIFRAFRLLTTQPIIQVLALYRAFQNGLTYLLLSSFPTLYTTVYHESLGISGLNYISIALGLLLGTQLCVPLADPIFHRLKARNNGTELPEYRVPLMIPASFLVPIGLFWYGWTAEAHAHWILPNIGVVILSVGLVTANQSMTGYIVDAYPVML